MAQGSVEIASGIMGGKVTKILADDAEQPNPDDDHFRGSVISVPMASLLHIAAPYVRWDRPAHPKTGGPWWFCAAYSTLSAGTVLRPRAAPTAA